MTDIKSMTMEELTHTLREMGQPAFRGGQVFTWLHRGVTSFEEMSDLPRALREQLAQTFHITAPTVARKQESRLNTGFDGQAVKNIIIGQNRDIQVVKTGFDSYSVCFPGAYALA